MLHYRQCDGSRAADTGQWTVAAPWCIPLPAHMPRQGPEWVLSWLIPVAKFSFSNYRTFLVFL
jgi:hypothetical protein